MGSNKLLLKYKEKCILQYIIEEVIKSNCFYEVFVVVSDEKIKEIVEGYDVNLLWNINADLGQSEAIKLAVKNLDVNCNGTMFCVGDQPLMTCDVIKELVNEFNNDNIVIPVYKEKRGNPVIFPKKVFNELLDLSGDVGGRIVVNNNKELIKFIELSSGEFLKDIDTKDDYEELLKGEMTNDKK